MKLIIPGSLIALTLGIGTAAHAGSSARWACMTGGNGMLEVRADLNNGEVRLELKGSNLAANVDVSASLDADGDSTGDLTVMDNSEDDGVVQASAETASTAADLDHAMATSNSCTLARVN